MKKQPTPEDLGLAAKLLYGSDDEQTESKIRQSSHICKSNYSARLRRYEQKKEELRQSGLSPQQFEIEIKKLAERCRI